MDPVIYTGGHPGHDKLEEGCITCPVGLSRQGLGVVVHLADVSLYCEGGRVILGDRPCGGTMELSNRHPQLASNGVYSIS